MVNERGAVDLSRRKELHGNGGDNDAQAAEETLQLQRLQADLAESRRDYIKSLDKRIIENPLAATIRGRLKRKKVEQTRGSEPPMPASTDELAEEYLGDLQRVLEHEADSDNTHLVEMIGEEWREFGAIQAVYGDHNKDSSRTKELASYAAYGMGGVALGVGSSVVHLGIAEPALVAGGLGMMGMAKRTKPSRKDIERSFKGGGQFEGVSDAESRVALLMNRLHLDTTENDADTRGVVRVRAIDWMDENKKKYRVGTYSQLEQARYDAVKQLEEELDEPGFDIKNARVTIALKLMLAELEAMQDKQLKAEHRGARRRRVGFALATTVLTAIPLMNGIGSGESDTPKEQPTEQIEPTPPTPAPTKEFDEIFPGDQG